jgi:hypothetical protein
MFETNDVEWDKILNGLYEDEAVRKEIQDKLLEVLIYGGRNYLDNNTSIHPNALDIRRVPTELPQKICDYRKPKVYWFGELHGSNNLYHNEGFEVSRHWAVERGMIMHYKLEEHFESKRFIDISEPVEQYWEEVDNDFLKSFTGEAWVETKTLNSKTSQWKPQGEVFIGGSRPLKINEKDKETLEQVERIEYP